jgi:hypothetical protein
MLFGDLFGFGVHGLDQRFANEKCHTAQGRFVNAVPLTCRRSDEPPDVGMSDRGFYFLCWFFLFHVGFKFTVLG